MAGGVSTIDGRLLSSLAIPLGTRVSLFAFNNFFDNNNRGQRNVSAAVFIFNQPNLDLKGGENE